MLKQKAFTLIELMIAAAIMAIFATMAVPVFRDRVIKAQVEEGLALAGLAVDAVETFRNKTGEVPGDNRTAGIPIAEHLIGNYVTRVEISAGAIDITFGNRAHRDIHGKRLSLRPAIHPLEKRTPIAWICGKASVPEGMHALGIDKTDFLSQELPIKCRI